MEMTLLSRLCYDKNQTHPVAQSFPAFLDLVTATLKVMTLIKAPDFVLHRSTWP